jgi:hypothetical protein
MSRISILKSTISTARAGLFFLGMLSPAHAAYQHDAVAIFPDLPISATADHADGKKTNSAVARNRSLELTSRLPWLAPVGHRQPHRSEVPRSEDVSAWDRRQQQVEEELDRHLVICRGC